MSAISTSSYEERISNQTPSTSSIGEGVEVLATQPLPNIEEVFAKSIESLKGKSYFLELPPIDVQRLILAELDLKSLIGLYCTNRYWMKFVRQFIQGNIKIPINENFPLYIQVLIYIGKLQHQTAVEFKPVTFDNNYAFKVSNNGAIVKMPLLKRIDFIVNLEKNLAAFQRWKLLIGISKEQMPRINLNLPIQVTDLVNHPHNDNLLEVCSVMYKMQSECKDLIADFEDFQNARSTLVTWEKLVLAVPEKRREYLEGPGLINFESPQVVIDKAKEFSVWFNQFEKTLSAHVTELELDQSGLTILPDQLCQLTRLRKLNVDKNFLTFLPNGLGNLAQLQYLSLVSNALNDFPDEICKLTQLQCLILDINRLKSVPRELGALTQLVALGLGRNKLSSLPIEINRLAQLQLLDVNDNELSSIPRGILNLPHVLDFNFDNNPLTLSSRILVVIAPFKRELFILGSIAVLIGCVAEHYFGSY